MELGIPYVLTGPDGARAVFGNSDAARLDADWVGYLDPEQGITGLLDGAEVRAQPVDVPAGDGADLGPAFLAARTGTIQVILDPNVAFATRESYERKLKRASRGLRADCTLQWTPNIDGIARLMRLRRTARPAPAGRHPRSVQLNMASGDPYVLSADEQSVTLTPGVFVPEIGIVDPITDPITSDLNVAAQQFVTNLGDAATWPRLRITGPITNPQVLNQTTGQRVQFTYTLAAGEWLDVYPEHGQVLLGGTADRYAAYDFAASEWWQLVDGDNDVRVLATDFAAGANVAVFWRHAFE